MYRSAFHCSTLPSLHTILNHSTDTPGSHPSAKIYLPLTLSSQGNTIRPPLQNPGLDYLDEEIGILDTSVPANMLLDDDSTFAQLDLVLKPWSYDAFIPFFFQTILSIIFTLVVGSIYMAILLFLIPILLFLACLVMAVVGTLLHLIFFIGAPCLVEWLIAKDGKGYMERFWEKSDSWTSFEKEAEAADVEALRYQDGSDYEGSEWSADMETLCGDEEDGIGEGEVTEKVSVESDEEGFVTVTA